MDFRIVEKKERRRDRETERWRECRLMKINLRDGKRNF